MRIEEEDGLSGFIDGVDGTDGRQMGTPVFQKPHSCLSSFNGLTKRKYLESHNAPRKNCLLLSHRHIA